ncbi:MAG: hypothetical protein IJ569_00505 [Prevotella sp.]|nr:hypothetical protein [Prevotella sp.]
MKCKTLINLIVLGILTGMPSISFGKERKDSLILNRIYEFKDAHQDWVDSIQDNVYLKCRYNVERRNPTMWLIPTLYVMAKDEREYIRESYNDVTYLDKHKFDLNRQLLTGTISHDRRAMPTLLDMMTPNIYDVALYDGHILSPFNKANRSYYKFTQSQLNDSTTRLDFKPKIYNTQLLNGYAIINTANGHIIRTILNGEFDMISFRTEIRQSPENWPLPTPIRCTTAATFRFVGNRISTVMTTDYNCKPLPDSIQHLSSREAMDSLRPVPLTEMDKQIYSRYDKAHEPDTTKVDTVPQKPNLLKKIFWDTIGETLVTPISAESEQLYVQLSPIINPLYVSYSDSRGLSYKMRLRFQYSFSAHRYLSLNPTLGYNFKIKQFFFNAPLRMTYNPKRNGYAEIIFANGNRIGNSTVEEAVRQKLGLPDSVAFEDKDQSKFNDTYFRVFNNIMIFDWLDIESGIVYHHRDAVNKDWMRSYEMPTGYKSFALMMGAKIEPWHHGPLFSIDWERSIKGILNANIDYERWEFDASWKHRMSCLRVLNLRAGYGVYSRKAQNYFVDFANFQDSNLPEGWDDDWSGDFQLLNSDEYNRSIYYIRGNISYESPMLFATRIPYLGKYIEKERLYISSVLLKHSRPYFEIGYGFTNRYLSAAAFASFKSSTYQEVGFKFEFELFRRW